MTDAEERIAAIEASDITGPNKLAAICEIMIPHLIELREAATSLEERKSLNQRLATNRRLLKFAKSRQGYIEEPKE